VSVEGFAGECEEEAVTGRFAGVREDGFDRGRGVVPDETAAGGVKQFVQRERSVVHQKSFRLRK
jgi:hypothetical protein